MIPALCFTHHPTFSFYHYLIFLVPPEKENGLIRVWGSILDFALCSFFSLIIIFTVVVIVVVIILLLLLLLSSLLIFSTNNSQKVTWPATLH